MTSLMDHLWSPLSIKVDVMSILMRMLHVLQAVERQEEQDNKNPPGGLFQLLTVTSLLTASQRMSRDSKRSQRDWDDQAQQSQPPPKRTGFIGTEQPALDLDGIKNKDKNKYLPVHLQEVRDERGRKRLHGAFTGGFSAGYYNSVGSKEGWAPSQFKSSRGEKGGSNPGNATARPEDFMDEEDLQELADSKKIAATDEFDVLGGTERELQRRRAVASSQMNQSAVGPLPTKVIADLIGPSTDPIGIKLLRQMGWREGQGVGARVARSGETEDIHATNVLFAPKDSTLISYEQKTNVFGLGFDPYKNAQEFTSRDMQIDEETEETPEPRRGQFGMKGGFGTGMFDEDDEIGGDDDVYDTKSSFTMVIDDDEDEFDAATIKKRLQALEMEKKNKSSGNRKKAKAFSASRAQPLPATRIQFCHDGKLPLRGFELAINPSPLTKWFEPPPLPSNFLPMHHFDKSGPRPELSTKPLAWSSAQQQSTLTADQRRDILGEKPLDGPSRSVFSFIPIKEQDRLMEFLDRASSSNAKLKQDKKEEEAIKEIPKVDKVQAQAALKGFMPFGGDAAKQGRYTRFLQVHAGIETELAKPPPDMLPRDAHHELVEFSKAAQIFQPLSATMASRFTTASSGAPATETKVVEKVVPLHIITRSKEIFYPNRLLCKRFNVPNPYPDRKDDSAAGGTGAPDVLNQDIMDELLRERDNKVAHGDLTMLGGPTTEMLGRETAADDGNQQPISDADAELEQFGGAGIADTEPERPTMDIFKDIFGDSDDDEDGEDQAEVIVPKIATSVSPTTDKASSLAIPAVVSPIVEEPQSFRPVFVSKDKRKASEKPPSSHKATAVVVPMEVDTPVTPIIDLEAEEPPPVKSIIPPTTSNTAPMPKPEIIDVDASSDSSDGEDDAVAKQPSKAGPSSTRSTASDEAERKRLKKEAKKAKKAEKKQKHKKNKKEKKKKSKKEHHTDDDGIDDVKVVDNKKEEVGAFTEVKTPTARPPAADADVFDFKKNRPRAVDYL
ncbi:hypothetical protein SmJEL517_g04158 [Synchytrium microbalum]|uniref:G-patch domain-containing protein n=1 Tax=Synchytrium microbalum TaxID=1806994 RepID=A0A507C5Q0_9FUNG|nr:uncharacterized protein SmJEL517_g04158 [Synchytrium microbalum]TPX32795.1 hypothetical protein SmJEL517_g04158 [Synchytrium microbalum]